MASCDLFSDFRKKLTSEQVELLVAHVLRNPEIYKLAGGRLNYTHFPDEPGLAVLLNVSSDLVKRSGPALIEHPSFERQIRTEARRQLSASDDCLVDAEQLLGPEGRIAKEKRRRYTLGRLFAIPQRELESQCGRQLFQQFLRERALWAPLERMSVEAPGSVPENIEAILREVTERCRSIDQISVSRPLTVAAGFDDFQRYRAQFIGQRFLGLKTGMERLDRCTLGLRGIMLFAARPNVGKTALAMHVGLSMLNQQENADAALLFISLDMIRAELQSRILAHLADVELRFALTELSQTSMAEQKRWKQSLRSAEQQMRESVGRRIAIVDQADLGSEVTPERLSALIERTKRDTGATRVLTVIDYLQLFGVPEAIAKQGDLAADKFRVQLLQQTRELTSTALQPKGEPLLVISEARKPPSSREAWRPGLADLMGSARLAYAADAVLSLQDMEPDQVKDAYKTGTDEAAVRRLECMKNSGVVPLTLKVEKARDGMTRDEWGVEFSFRTYRFAELASNIQPDSSDDTAVERPVGNRRGRRGGRRA